MSRAFQIVEKVFYFIEVSWQSKIDRFHLERLSRRLFRCRQPEPERIVHHLFERMAGLPCFLFKQLGNIFIQRKCCSHIMMLVDETS